MLFVEYLQTIFGDNIKETINKIEELCKTNKKIVAIGEIGLDYYWNKENKDLQKQWFRDQIELANKLDLPIVIHSRDASYDTISVLEQEQVKQKGIFHCCQLNQELVKGALKLGFYVSFAGPITYKNSKNVEEIVKLVPIDKLLIETDSPYLSPEPFRGTRNNSINVKLVARKIAQIKNISIEEVAKTTYANTKKALKIIDN